MEDLLTKLFESQNQLMNNFNMGFASGVAFALLVIFVLMMLRVFTILIFRTKRTHCIAIRRPEGDTEISKNAVVSVIRSFGGDYKCIEVRKIDIFRRGARYFLRLKINFDTADGSLPTQETSLRKKIIDSLEKTFGITSVSRISLKLDQVTGEAIQTPLATSSPSATVRTEKPKIAQEPVKDPKASSEPEKKLEKADIKTPDPLP